MANRNKRTSPLAVASIVLCAVTAVAQTASDRCKPSPIIPLAGGDSPTAKIVIDPPLLEPLVSRGVAIIQYCAENLWRYSVQMLWLSRRASDTFT